jgi:hypothetical protein
MVRQGFALPARVFALTPRLTFDVERHKTVVHLQIGALVACRGVTAFGLHVFDQADPRVVDAAASEDYPLPVVHRTWRNAGDGAVIPGTSKPALP